jgi:NADH:ubiquinone oxidoreductase subunit 6 (subunit J)
MFRALNSLFGERLTLYAAIFYLLSAVTVIATAMSITRRQPVHVVLCLIVAFLSTAARFYLLGAPLLAANSIFSRPS